MRSITYGTVGENQKTGLPATQTVRVRNARTSGARRAISMLPDRSTRVPVPASAYVPGGAGWGLVLVRLIYGIIFWLLSL
jgi:hypothetical protein